jgi:hypothetical protein
MSGSKKRCRGSGKQSKPKGPKAGKKGRDGLLDTSFGSGSSAPDELPAAKRRTRANYPGSAEEAADVAAEVARIRALIGPVS